MKKRFVAVAVAAVLVSGCDQKSERKEAQATLSPASSPDVTPEQRAKLVETATAGMERSFDKMESIAFYAAKGEPWVGTGLTLYLSVPQTVDPILRFMPRYRGDSWIFFRHIKVMADSEIVYDKSFEYLKMSHDTGAGYVYESIDYPATPDDIVAIRKIANAKSVLVRLSGEDKREDFDVDEATRVRVRRVLKAYDDLSLIRSGS
jgi:hypothetical protein